MSGFKAWVERQDPEETRIAYNARGDLNQQLIDALYNDFEGAQRLLESQYDVGFHRRTVVRTYFALVEGLTNVVATNVLWFADKALCDLSSADRDLLAERGAFAPLKTRVRSAFAIYNDQLIGPPFALHTDGYQIDTHSPHWAAFLRAIKVRNRLMHPKSVDNLWVSDREMESITENGLWFDNIFYRMMLASGEVCVRTLLDHVDRVVKRDSHWQHVQTQARLLLEQNRQMGQHPHRSHL